MAPRIPGPQEAHRVDTILFVAAALAALVFDLLAVGQGAESRDGFTE